MPSASPSSQWGLGSKSNVGFSPQVLTVTLSASDLPVGTSSRVRLGMLGERQAHLLVECGCGLVELVELVFQGAGFVHHGRCVLPGFLEGSHLLAELIAAGLELFGRRDGFAAASGPRRENRPGAQRDRHRGRAVLLPQLPGCSGQIPDQA